MIPPEKAVEAAAKALRKKFNGYEVERPWDSRDQRTTYRNDAIAALEAAAPYMLQDLRELVDDMEAQPHSEIGSVRGIGGIIRATMKGMI